jgi:hypothetical protein
MLLNVAQNRCEQIKINEHTKYKINTQEDHSTKTNKVLKLSISHCHQDDKS